jgi:hypothetical protein
MVWGDMLLLQKRPPAAAVCNFLAAAQDKEMGGRLSG